MENLVKKYASRVTTLKKITPHKLRSTYGTALYQETGDIYLVADVLGHSSIEAQMVECPNQYPNLYKALGLTPRKGGRLGVHR